MRCAETEGSDLWSEKSPPLDFAEEYSPFDLHLTERLDSDNPTVYSYDSDTYSAATVLDLSDTDFSALSSHCAPVFWTHYRIRIAR